MPIKTILMDLDGTVYRGSKIIPGALETIKFVREKHIQLFFFTNNSEKNRSEIANKLNGMGIECDKTEIISSGFLTTYLIKKRNYQDVYLSGSNSLVREFLDNGIDLTDEQHAKVLIIAMDSHFTYEKMKKAMNAAINSSMIIACNREKSFPCDNNELCPGAGAMVASIEFSSNRKVDEVIGKPNPIMFEYVSDLTGCVPEETIIIGDTFESDIALAVNCGAIGVLIGNNDHHRYCIQSIADFPRFIESFDND